MVLIYYNMEKNISQKKGMIMVKRKSKNVAKLNKVDAQGNLIPKKYHNPKKMGFLRVLMIFYGAVPFLLLFCCFFITKEQFVLNATTFNLIIDSIIYAIIFWMI